MIGSSHDYVPDQNRVAIILQVDKIIDIPAGVVVPVDDPWVLHLPSKRGPIRWDQNPTLKALLHTDRALHFEARNRGRFLGVWELLARLSRASSREHRMVQRLSACLIAWVEFVASSCNFQVCSPAEFDQEQQG